MTDARPTGLWRNAKPFVNSGLAGCLTLTVCHPIDLLKVRIQLGQGSVADVVRSVLKHEGARSFYTGWSAQMLRQLSYGTMRLGTFQWLRDTVSSSDSNGKLLPLPFTTKLGVGLIAGSVGAVVGNPADVALVRMQADKLLPVEQRRGYKNAFHALYRMACDEGILSLWRGCGPTILRAAALNMCSLAAFDQTKEIVDARMQTSSGMVAVGCASTIAGVTAAASSMPFDFVKTQVQNMKPGADGKMPYTGMKDCALQTIRRQGPAGLYVGFPVYCMRICPAVMLVFVFLEGIIKVEKKYGL